MNYYYKNNEKGFTLVELLIAMTIGLIILTALSSTFLLQRDAYDDQEQIAEMVQTARAAMDMMSREISMAGYAPTGAIPKTPTGTMQRSDPTGAKFVGIPYDANKLQIYADLNGDEDTDDSHEYIKYTMDSDYPFEIRRDTGGGRQEFALNIQIFNFSYWKDENEDGVLEQVITSADNDKIREIEITITARTAEPDFNYTNPTYGGHYRTYEVKSFITPRNLGL